MGEKIVYQSLTTWDKLSVVLYRMGIVIFSSTIIYTGIYAILHWKDVPWTALYSITDTKSFNLILYTIYFSVGLSVFTIHLYVKRFRKFIKLLYTISLICLILLIIISRGLNLADTLVTKPATGLLLLPVAGCISFITMKEAFCFRLIEGYLITICLPFFILVFSTRLFSPYITGAFLLVIGLLIAFFTVRKVFMPIAYDIGDKTAYEV